MPELPYDENLVNFASIQILRTTTAEDVMRAQLPNDKPRPSGVRAIAADAVSGYFFWSAFSFAASAAMSFFSPLMACRSL